MSQDQFFPSFEGTWARLSQVAVNGAEYNSRERVPHPKCLQGTRVDLLNYIYDSLDDRQINRLIWLHGTAGVGKSAVAFTVAERMEGLKVTEQTYVEKRLAGTFFFSRKHTKRCTTGYFFATLVYQLAINFPSIKKDVNRAIRDNPTLLDPDKALCVQMEALFLQPLRNLQLKLRGCPPLSFVVDALDECTSEHELTDLILALAQALRDPDIPVTQILLTSRSESHIRKAFQNAKVQPLLCEIPVKTSGDGIGSIISLDGDDVDKDIHTFLRYSFRELASRHRDFPQPSGDQLRQLASRAGRRFIVASTMMKFIIDDEDNDPHDRLQLMLKLTCALLPGTEVYKLYDSILSTCADPKRAFLHLSIVASLADPLSMAQISKLLGPGLGRDVETTLVQLRSVMDIPTDTSLPVNIHHSSIRDYVSNPSNCSLLHDAQSPHSLLADSSLRLMMREIPESTALLDALSELRKQSQAMTPDDPHRLKDSLSFLVQPPEPLSVLIGMLWLRGDGGSDLRFWIETLDGRAWLRSLGGRDWLRTLSGRDWLQTQGGRGWLQTQGGREWLLTLGGREWLLTLGGREWGQTLPGREWLQTQAGRSWLQAQAGEWLQTLPGRDWMQTLAGRELLQRLAGREWMQTLAGQEWLQSLTGREWMQTLTRREWLESQAGQKWLQILAGREWLQTLAGRSWLLTEGREWLQTQAGREWQQSLTERYWLQTQAGGEWLQTQAGGEWLQTQAGWNWLRTQAGWDWLRTYAGKKWLQTLAGGEWLQTQAGGEWLQTQAGGEWLQTQAGGEWLQTQAGGEWLQTQARGDWLPAQGGLVWERDPGTGAWVQVQGGQGWLQTQGGREWLQTQAGWNWLQTQPGRDWLQTQAGRDWLQTPGGRDWLQTPGGRDWLPTLGGRDWLQTSHGQAWQSTSAASVWVIMEEFSSTFEAISEYVIVPELPLPSTFQVVQQFKSLPDFLMFPMFLALMPRDHSASALPEGHLPPDREIIRAMSAFTTFAHEAQERSQSASGALKYACQNWVVHLSRAPNPWDDTLNRIFQAFWNRHLLSWLEQQWCLKGLRSCLDILSEGQKLAKACIF